jgi:hypothetical protein
MRRFAPTLVTVAALLPALVLGPSSSASQEPAAPVASPLRTEEDPHRLDADRDGVACEGLR